MDSANSNLQYTISLWNFFNLVMTATFGSVIPTWVWIHQNVHRFCCWNLVCYCIGLADRVRITETGECPWPSCMPSSTKHAAKDPFKTLRSGWIQWCSKGVYDTSLIIVSESAPILNPYTRATIRHCHYDPAWINHFFSLTPLTSMTHPLSTIYHPLNHPLNHPNDPQPH